MNPPGDLARILANVPVVALADGVLFPGIVLPLQLRGRPVVELVADVTHGWRHLVICHATAQHQRTGVGCLARLVHAKPRADGSVDVLLEGLRRVAMVREVNHPRPYRCVQAAALPPPSPADVRAASLQLAALYSCLTQLMPQAIAREPSLAALLRATAEPLRLVDLLAAALVSGAAQQQAVLASRRLADRLQLAIAALAEKMLQLGNVAPPRRA